MLKQLHLQNFRAFRDFRLSFGDGAYLVGPNNAGKSTLLTALRAADFFLRYAKRRKPEIRESDRDIGVLAYPASLKDFPALRDSLRFEFGDDPVRLELSWKDGSQLVAVWPDESEDEREAFFYLINSDGSHVKNPAQARDNFPALGIVPILGPTEHSEKLLDDAYVRQSVATRLSSRHFRNQLRLLDEAEEIEAFLEWSRPWLGDLEFDTLKQEMTDDGWAVRAFFYETGSRVPKEIVWAGDGVQVWLQLLYHVYRVKDLPTIVLDEPEVYLHPDLQRRLVHLLESTGRQIVVATHSAELVAESDGRLTTLVDRKRARASRPRSEADFEMLSSTLGTAFNLRLAKALRSKVAVFVEGQDMMILRQFARTLGLDAIHAEAGITIIPLQGYSNWGFVEPFAWLCEQLLPDALATFVILDRDYRTEQTRKDVMQKFEVAGIHGHVWQRKELESYLINSTVIARLSGAPVQWIETELSDIAAAQENMVFGRQLDEYVRQSVAARNHAASINSEFKTAFDERWSDPNYRLVAAPPKDMISKLNTRLQTGGFKSVSMPGLAKAHRRTEVPQELADVLRMINDRATAVS